MSKSVRSVGLNPEFSDRVAELVSWMVMYERLWYYIALFKLRTYGSFG